MPKHDATAIHAHSKSAPEVGEVFARTHHHTSHRLMKTGSGGSRAVFIGLALVIVAGLGVIAGLTRASADNPSVQRIHADGGDGWSFDVVLPSIHSKQEPATVAIEGDSMSAITSESIYDIRPGSDLEVWWLRLNPNLNLKFFAFAQGRSGYLQQGAIYPDSQPQKKKNGTNFQQRLAVPKIADAIQKADMFWIAGGFNDPHANPTKAELEKAVNRYMDDVLTLRTAGRHDPETVIVTSLWAQGANDRDRKWVIPIIKKQARQHGFTYVSEEGVFRSSTDTIDGVHYKGRAGDRIADRFKSQARLERTLTKLQKN